MRRFGSLITVLILHAASVVLAQSNVPAIRPSALPDNETDCQALQARISSLTVKRPSGYPTSPLADKVTGQWFEFATNDLDIKAISLDLQTDNSKLIVRTSKGDITTPSGFTIWKKSAEAFAVGMNQFVSVPEKPLIAARGAWTEDNVLTLKLVAYETPFYTTLNMRFDDNRLLIDAEHNAAFGPTKLPELIGER